MAENNASYAQFVDSYARVVARGAEAWHSPDLVTRVGGVDNALRLLGAIDAQYPHYVDRAALLGPELGGTVVPRPTFSEGRSA